MDAKEEVRARLAIEDVIGEYVQLKRAGRNWKGLSPFAPEKTPSFVVSPDKGIWHDFSSGRGGDMFSFVMEVEGLDFRQALELLARRAGIDLEQYNGGSRGPSGESKERLYKANELAARFYQEHFKKNKVALEYVLKKRAFTKETALEWQLGYSPNNGNALVDFLKNKGFTAAEIKLAGLSSQRGGDMFRGRLQIPLCDTTGRVIGFTARLLEDNPQAPKYINTPATPLYDKSRHVFGLHLSKEAIRKNKFVVLAEGNLDVIASHQAGVRQVVATAGTALTEYQLKALGRLAPDVRLSFDADKAGVAATVRAIPIAEKAEVQLSIITIPSGKDPDELIRQDVAAWQAIVLAPKRALDWLIDQYGQLADLRTQMGRESFRKDVFPLIGEIKNPGEQSFYINKVAEVLTYPDVEGAREDFRSFKKDDDRYRIMRTEPKHVSQDELAQQNIESHLMALTLMLPKLRKYLYPLAPEMFTSDDARIVFEFLSANPDYDGTDKRAVQKFADYAKILSLVYETLYQDLEPLELGYEARRLTANLIAQYVRTEKGRISERLQHAGAEEGQELLEQAAKLDKLLRTNVIKEGTT